MITFDPARIIHALPTRLLAVVIEAAIESIQHRCRVLSLLRRVQLRICCRRAGQSAVAIRVQASLPLHGCDVSITSSRRCYDVAAPKGPFCATHNFTIESCISHCYVWGRCLFFASRASGWQRVRMLLVVRPKYHHCREMQRCRRSPGSFAVFQNVAHMRNIKWA